ncbi:MAG: hypothetical protein Q4F63_03090 [Clostridia bacterium]|nr:hypothetical protein [Clostridia bacterium]
MGNDISNYSCSNVEAMVKSVKSNTEIINNMLVYTKSNDKEISERLSDYAKVKKNLGDDQIEMYRSYVNYKNNIENTLKEYSEKIENNGYLHQMTLELHSVDSDYSVLHRVFEEINKLQVRVMEMLCGVISQANLLLGSL